ncbi:hypothetical protein POX_a01114 [Penicillium oxalicum]|uniref:C2H2-type domain-containing protein n=1 Tax=Penicillium oxalicum (strain 114-2 / CGMCC 5302) TaxID=933388 RepID=S7ZU18_PENO1|nr:hypothetical protein POX_a01114 [Penicillium oxalicum]EPS33894.1 hypothetical protein PDE_08856 [Penicillium oxalicum 114-2]KAI2794515.1 hypothetical protein POX_a01114 [Penicillium oxalicum]
MSPENSNSCYSQSQISCQPTFLPHPDPELCPPTHESGFDSAYHRRVNPSLGSDYSWPFHILAPGVSSCSQQQQLLPVSLPLQSNTSLPLSTEVPLTASDFEIALSVKRLGTKHAGNSGHQGKPVPDESTTRSSELPAYPMSVASSPYLIGLMQQNNDPYIWGNRSYPPQPPTGNFNQQIPPQQSYPPTQFPQDYQLPPGGPASYVHPHTPQQSSPYLPVASGGIPRQVHAQSPPIAPAARSFHAQSAPAVMTEQSFATGSSPYMMNQPTYYFPEAHTIPSTHSSHSSPISPQASSVPLEGVFHSPSALSSGDSRERPVRGANARPRPQCWDHGCDGREFSTFSNLLRHQREKSGVVAKAECPVCGAVFTRTTARNIHVAQGKCKGSGRESSTD